MTIYGAEVGYIPPHFFDVPAGNKDAKMDRVRDPISEGGKQQVTGRNRQVTQLHTEAGC